MERPEMKFRFTMKKDLFTLLFIAGEIRDRTLSMQDERRRVFVEAMKYFRHILMGHQIFPKIFDGPQNIFFCSIFIFFFFLS